MTTVALLEEKKKKVPKTKARKTIKTKIRVKHRHAVNPSLA